MKKTIRLTDEELVAAVEAAAKRDHRSITNFVLRLLDLTKIDWMKADWDDLGPGYCVHSRFGRGEFEALQQIAGNIEPPESRTVEIAVEFIVKSALVHWDKAEPLLVADGKYSKDEGFASLQHFHTQTIAAKFTPKARAPMAR